MFAPSRTQVRDFFFEIWRKYQAKEILTPLETQALDWVLEHPEYHALLNAPEIYRERDYLPEFGETNPFLHLSLHLSIVEQVSIDQPPGIKAQYQRLCSAKGDAHQAAHALLECLGQAVWQAQRDGTGMNEQAYIECIRKQQ